MLAIKGKNSFYGGEAVEAIFFDKMKKKEIGKMKVWVLSVRHKNDNGEKVVGVYESEEKLKSALSLIQKLLPLDYLRFNISVYTVE